MVLNSYKTFNNKTFNKNVFKLVNTQVIKAKDLVIVHDYKKGNLCYMYKSCENTIGYTYSSINYEFNIFPTAKSFIKYAYSIEDVTVNPISFKAISKNCVDSMFNYQLQLYGIRTNCLNDKSSTFSKNSIVFKLLIIENPFDSYSFKFSIRQRFFYTVFLYIITNAQYFWSTSVGHTFLLSKIFQQNKSSKHFTNKGAKKNPSLFFSTNSARKYIRYANQFKIVTKRVKTQRTHLRFSIKKWKKSNTIGIKKSKFFAKNKFHTGNSSTKKALFNAKMYSQSYSFKLFATNKNRTQPVYFSLNHLKNLLTLITGSRFSLYGINAMAFSRFSFDQERKVGLYVNSFSPINAQVSPVKSLNAKTAYRFIRSIERERLSRFRYVAVYIQDLIRIAFFSMFRKKSAFLATFLAFTLSKLPRNRKETQFIRFLRKLVKVFASQRKEILGIRIRFQGRVNRWRRTKHIVGEKGSTSFYNFDIRRDYGNAQAITRKGALGIRFWIAYQSFFFNTFRIARLKYVQTSKKMNLYRKI